LTLRFNGDYTMFSSDKDKIKNVLAQQFTVGGEAANPSLITYEGLNASIVSLTINGIGKIPTGSNVTPYGILGAGVHILNLSNHKVEYQGLGDITQDLINVGVISQPTGETKFGMNFGAGIEFKLGNLKVFVEGKYVMIFTKDEKTGIIPVTVGVGI
jgi:opacity protein-like surface antigen